MDRFGQLEHAFESASSNPFYSDLAKKEGGQTVR